MKARIKFQKYGAMKFIGHLDVMRYFQKAFRRAGYDNEYTKGFNPHQIMSFAAPLGLGLTSDGEYVDISLLSSQAPKDMVEKLNNVLTEGFNVVGFHLLREPGQNEKHVNAMSLVSKADYLVSLKDGYRLKDGFQTQDEFREAFENFYAKREIFINKKTKTSQKNVDIKPMISVVSFSAEEFAEKLKDRLMQVKRPVNDERSFSLEAKSVADVYENGIKVYMQLDTGSTSNLKPELVIEAFCQENDIEYNPYAWQVHRLELYTGDEENGRLIPLDCLDR
ncbi:MAG TPA: TIGR03936 family radical SAM-associated protein [Mobilitalea sp.]|nr:TIGR03936 family radical SAM-associated protein [Mobilitalea sp.]